MIFKFHQFINESNTEDFVNIVRDIEADGIQVFTGVSAHIGDPYLKFNLKFYDKGKNIPDFDDMIKNTMERIDQLFDCNIVVTVENTSPRSNLLYYQLRFDFDTVNVDIDELGDLFFDISNLAPESSSLKNAFNGSSIVKMSPQIIEELRKITISTNGDEDNPEDELEITIDYGDGNIEIASGNDYRDSEYSFPFSELEDEFITFRNFFRAYIVYPDWLKSLNILPVELGEGIINTL